jgi:hypothetical protein
MMDNSKISLKPVKELLGMNFFIPDYQRGYRWEKQQAIDLLEDILAFANKAVGSEEIYCIQPLVVSEKEDDILSKCKSPEAKLEDIKKYIKGSWTVVDGQQRLTTVYLILTCLGIPNEDKYEIDYCTRSGSREFLLNIQTKNKGDAYKNIDFFHMHSVYITICEWLASKDEQLKEKVKETLLNQVHFIWYQINEKDEISVFTRLNIGKIPLTDAELIKALFLNRGNLSYLPGLDKSSFETKQKKIALEWDQIEYALQNDEFWAFIHDMEYDKPTRIDYIFESICNKDGYLLYRKGRRNTKNNKNRDDDVAFNANLSNRIGNDEHKTFRYFNEKFNEHDKEEDWLDKLWGEVLRYYQVFNEWYQDYQLYHYIGYLTTIAPDKDITNYVGEWEGKTKNEFIRYIKNQIVQLLKKKDWICDLKNYRFEQDGNKGKRECVDILLLHNIETIIQQNVKLVKEAKYNLPNFSKFPFHIFKKEKWQVEHIRPNAGDDLKDPKLYLYLAKKYFEKDEELSNRIKDYLENLKEGDPEKIIEDISQKGGTLSEDDKNKIWNYVLLDELTNKEYGNQIFPVKRAFIANKEKGKKVKYIYDNKGFREGSPIPEIAFVPPCTKNVFAKFYTSMPTTMINWNTEDAKAYWEDIAEKLQYYFEIIGVKQ